MSAYGTCPYCADEFRASDPVEVRFYRQGPQVKAVSACGATAWFQRVAGRWVLICVHCPAYGFPPRHGH